MSCKMLGGLPGERAPGGVGDGAGDHNGSSTPSASNSVFTAKTAALG